MSKIFNEKDVQKIFDDFDNCEEYGSDIVQDALSWNLMFLSLFFSLQITATLALYDLVPVFG